MVMCVIPYVRAELFLLFFCCFFGVVLSRFLFGGGVSLSFCLCSFFLKWLLFQDPRQGGGGSLVGT